MILPTELQLLTEEIKEYRDEQEALRKAVEQMKRFILPPSDRNTHEFILKILDGNIAEKDNAARALEYTIRAKGLRQS
tara:strand:- start:228 stop:461 length:234 start_codon:yes stop_codon:yes gene_type:complete